MKKSRFTAEQIVSIIERGDQAGDEAGRDCRTHGITEQTYYRWRRAYGGLKVSEAKRLRALADENRRLKVVVAEQALDVAMLKDVAGRKW